jgi:hypothetical protein
MPKLSNTQAIILTAAAQRADGNLLPLPGSLRGGAASKVIGALLSRGFAEEMVIDDTRPADPALSTIWRNLDDGRGVLLVITPEGLDAIGVEPESAAGTSPADRRAVGADSGDEAASRSDHTAEPDLASVANTAPPRHKTREGTKQAQLIAMLRRKEGATIAQIVAATGWQPHTVRGAFAGALKKKLGLIVTSEKVEGGERTYRLAPEA